jgi:hypothetical protein
MAENLELLRVQGVTDPARVHAIDTVLRSWGLGDRHALVVSARVAAYSRRFLASDQLTSRQREAAGDDKFNELRALEQAYLSFEFVKPWEALRPDGRLAATQHALARAKRCIKGSASVADPRLAVYVVGVASVFANATGVDPDRLMGGPGRTTFERFLLACMSLIQPQVTLDAVQCVSENVFDASRRRFHVYGKSMLATPIAAASSTSPLSRCGYSRGTKLDKRT